jgi:putative transcriptional regulator
VQPRAREQNAFLKAHSFAEYAIWHLGLSVTELADNVGITIANLSILKNGKARAIRFSTLEGLCKALDCQPGDILEYRNDEIPRVSSASVAS